MDGSHDVKGKWNVSRRMLKKAVSKAAASEGPRRILGIR
jgi:hypothetical protein